MISIEKSRYFKYKYLVFLFLLNITIYINSVFMEFVWDDILHGDKFEGIVHSIFDFSYFFAHPNIVGQDFYYRPFMLLFYAIDFLLYKDNFLGYHITSLFLHILTVISLFFLTNKLFKSEKIALIASLLFTIHPTHSEAVTWISARADILVTFFLLLSFYFYIDFIETEKKKPLFLHLFFYACALLSKEVGIIFPLIILFHILINKKSIDEKNIKSLGGLLVISIVFFFIRAQIVSKVVGDPLPFEMRLATFPFVILYSLKLYLFPFNLKLLYKEPHLITNFFQPKVFLAYLLLSIVVIAIAFIFRKKREVFLYTIWFFIFILPFSGLVSFVRVSLIADRYLYLPSVGLSITLGYVLYQLSNRESYKKLIGILLVFLVLIFGYLSIERNKAWDNNIKVITRMTEEMPDYYLPYMILGKIYLEERRFEESEKALLTSLKLQRGLQDEKLIFNNLGTLYEAWSKYIKAEQMYMRAIELDPGYYNALRNLAHLYITTNRLDEAYFLLSTIAPRFSDKSDLFNLLAMTCIKMGILEEALSYIEEAIRLEPYNEGLKGNKQLILKLLSKSGK